MSPLHNFLVNMLLVPFSKPNFLGTLQALSHLIFTISGRLPLFSRRAIQGEKRLNSCSRHVTRRKENLDSESRR